MVKIIAIILSAIVLVAFGAWVGIQIYSPETITKKEIVTIHAKPQVVVSNKYIPIYITDMDDLPEDCCDARDTLKNRLQRCEEYVSDMSSLVVEGVSKDSLHSAIIMFSMPDYLSTGNGLSADVQVYTPVREVTRTVVRNQSPFGYGIIGGAGYGFGGVSPFVGFGVFIDLRKILGGG